MTDLQKYTAVVAHPGRIDGAVVDGRLCTHPNGMLLDNAHSRDCWAKNYYSGAGATLVRSSKPGGMRNDMPTLDSFEADHCANGIIVDCVDTMINAPRVCAIEESGIDWLQGASSLVGGQFYGMATPGGIGGITRKTAAKVSVNGTEFSDARKGFVALGNGGQLTALYSERCLEHNLLIGAETIITSAVIIVDTFVGEKTDWTPTCIEFATRADKEFGDLNANWSQMIGGMIDLSPGATGIHLSGAHMVTAKDVRVNGPANSTALLIDQPIDGADIDLKICGPGVAITTLGQHCRISLRYHNTAPQIYLPAEWDQATTEITVNRRRAKPGDYPSATSASEKP